MPSRTFTYPSSSMNQPAASTTAGEAAPTTAEAAATTTAAAAAPTTAAAATPTTGSGAGQDTCWVLFLWALFLKLERWLYYCWQIYLFINIRDPEEVTQIWEYFSGFLRQ